MMNFQIGFIPNTIAYMNSYISNVDISKVSCYLFHFFIPILALHRSTFLAIES